MIVITCHTYHVTTSSQQCEKLRFINIRIASQMNDNKNYGAIIHRCQVIIYKNTLVAFCPFTDSSLASRVDVLERMQRILDITRYNFRNSQRSRNLYLASIKYLTI